MLMFYVCNHPIPLFCKKPHTVMATIICVHIHLPEWRESELWISELCGETPSNYCMAPPSLLLHEDGLPLPYQWFIQQEESTLGSLTQYNHPCVLLQPRLRDTHMCPGLRLGVVCLSRPGLCLSVLKRVLTCFDSCKRKTALPLSLKVIVHRL